MEPPLDSIHLFNTVTKAEALWASCFPLDPQGLVPGTQAFCKYLLKECAQQELNTYLLTEL